MSPDLRGVVIRCLREIAPDADASAVPPDADLREALDLDSMDFLRFVQALHRALGVVIPESEYRAASTLAGCIATCERLAPRT